MSKTHVNGGGDTDTLNISILRILVGFHRVVTGLLGKWWNKLEHSDHTFSSRKEVICQPFLGGIESGDEVVDGS